MSRASLPTPGCSPSSQKRSVIRSTTRSAASRFTRVAQYTKISSKSRSACSETRYRLPARAFSTYELAPSGLHPIRKLLQPFTSLVFDELAYLDILDAGTHVPADAVKLLLSKL